MKKEEVIDWLMIMKANLNSFPEISNAKKIEALAEAIRLLKNEQSIDKIDCDNADCNNCVNHKYCDYETTISEKPNKSENPTSLKALAQDYNSCVKDVLLRCYNGAFVTPNSPKSSTRMIQDFMRKWGYVDNLDLVEQEAFRTGFETARLIFHDVLELELEDVKNRILKKYEIGWVEE